MGPTPLRARAAEQALVRRLDPQRRQSPRPPTWPPTTPSRPPTCPPSRTTGSTWPGCSPGGRCRRRSPPADRTDNRTIRGRLETGAATALWWGSPASRRVSGRARSAAGRRQSPTDLVGRLADVGYLPDEGLATAAYLALRDGPAAVAARARPGVGKTALAHALAEVAGRPLIRLQCYEGIDASQALYDWDFPPPAAAPARRRGAPAPASTPTRAGGRSCTTGGSCSPGRCCRRWRLGPSRAAGRRGRPGRRRVRGVPARGALRLHDHRARARHDRARPPRRWWCSPSNRTREVHDALKRRCLYHWLEHPDFDREVAILRRRLPEVTERLAARGGRRGRARRCASAGPAQAAGHRRGDGLGRGAARARRAASSTRTLGRPRRWARC